MLEKRQALEDEKNKLNGRVTAMPKTQQEIVRLTRDVESGQQVYMQLLNKQQELKITEASTVGDVRIVDPAIAFGVLKPKKGADYSRRDYPWFDAFYRWRAAALAVQSRH